MLLTDDKLEEIETALQSTERAAFSLSVAEIEKSYPTSVLKATREARSCRSVSSSRQTLLHEKLREESNKVGDKMMNMIS